MRDQRDQDKIDALIGTFFSAFDNRGDALPEIRRVTDCFTDKAVVVRHSKAETAIYTPVEFALPRIELLTRGALRNFHEYETDSNTSIFGGIATRTSRYSKLGELNGSSYSGAGTKCFQLVELGIGWRISSLAWIDDEA
ncbi:DUF4440 domain-containing protein [Montanilutibacter psychrotolerans]|uniref:DUF4440 domain-containing protein n=1 Tax=Montanilutibacter psychrotolerans TaxID=1327343 RepID=A0A3M8SUT2_9GAMM|nr:DUF4440 domain-containing protein [Lysobacter psychrotolerans]RNF85091.1 DUF4440 domain-containing protein [Lysobacter psychrotolerans]